MEPVVLRHILVLVITSLMASSHAAEIHLDQAKAILGHPQRTGDRFRLAFVTSAKRNALSADNGDYNSWVQQVADNSPLTAALGLKWQAIVSTPTVDARENVGVYGAVYRLDGAPLYLWSPEATTSSQFDFNLTEHGTPLRDDVLVWTGTDSNMKSSSPLGTLSPRSGLADGITTAWMDGGPKLSAHERHSLYAISEFLFVVPEPSSFAASRLVIVGLLVYVFQFKRQSRSYHRDSLYESALALQDDN